MADEPVVPEDEAGTAVDAEAEAADDADEMVAETAANEAPETAADEAPKEDAAQSERSHIRLALIVGVAVVVALGALTGWLGYRAYEARAADQLDELLVGVGRQGCRMLGPERGEGRLGHVAHVHLGPGFQEGGSDGLADARSPAGNQYAQPRDRRHPLDQTHTDVSSADDLGRGSSTAIVRRPTASLLQGASM